MNNDYEKLNSERAHSLSRARRRKALQRRRIMVATIAGVVALVLVIGTVLIVKKVHSKNEEPAEIAETVENPSEDDTASDAKIEVVYPDEEAADDSEEASDPESTATKETGAAVNVVDIVNASNVGENASITYGIDVSKFQGTIDWTQVASTGINFAMVRVGYRDSATGEIKADTNAKYNMQEAEKNGIKVGAYFFSTAVNNTEAVEEADWVANYISKYAITYPVGYNCEGFENSKSRQYNLTKDDRSKVAMAFLNEVYNKGYTPIFYASKNEMANDTKWNTSTIGSKYKIWMAWYNQDTSNVANGPSAGFKYDMWQYSNQGDVPGIKGKVDVNIAYFGYNGTESAKDTSGREVATADVEALMKFTEVNEAVTAKSKTNLRDKPSQGSDSTVKTTLLNGQVATRTGVSNSGWSRVVLDGATYYAVSSYLTTDTSAPAQTATPAPAPEPAPAPAAPGFKTKFTDVNETITAKEMVNLRSKPSVTDADSAVVVTLYNGQTAVRTGVNNEYGWSRVEYNGQVLYCVSSFIKVVE
ncbi:GH25 family lysozyme [Pseudobutyrivibrio sp.]